MALEAENATLRQQIIVLRCKLRGRARLSNGDRRSFVWLYRLFPSITRAVLIIRPDTLIRWHRSGFRHYWRWKSRGRIGRPPSQTWRAFLHNHAPDIAAIDLFVVPTISFGLLYGLVVIRIAPRNLVWLNVAAHPTAEWVARQLTEAFPWQAALKHLIRDRDAVYGSVVLKRLRSMGIRDH